MYNFIAALQAARGHRTQDRILDPIQQETLYTISDLNGFRPFYHQLYKSLGKNDIASCKMTGRIK